MNEPFLSQKVRVQREREFSPHHILIGAANMALESAGKKEPGWLYHELIAMMFSALALEALANSFGKRLITHWKDYETASPVAKLRIIAKELGVDPDFGEEPWSATLWLVSFRNKVAHARPESVKFDVVMTSEDFEKTRMEYPKSKLELDISTTNAMRAVTAVEDILHILCEKMNPEDLGGLLCDGFIGSTSSLHE